MQGFGIPLVPAQHGTDPGKEFAHGKRFCQVVVRTGIESADPVIHLCLCRQEDDRGLVAALPQFLEGCQPILAGHHDIEDHTVIRMPAGHIDCLLPVAGRVHMVAGMAQDSCNSHGHGLFIFCK